MIPSKEEFDAWLKPCFCFGCHKPITWPCSRVIAPDGVTVNLHKDCIWPTVNMFMDELLRIKGEHPEQMPTSQEFRFRQQSL